MTAKEAQQILNEARLAKVYAVKFLYKMDEYEIRFSAYSEAVYKKYEAARLFLLSVKIEAT